MPNTDWSLEDADSNLPKGVWVNKSGKHLAFVVDPVPVVVPPPPPPPPPTPTPAPTPTPPSNLTPSSIEHYKLDADGVWESQAGWQKDIAALGFDVAGVNYGKTVVLEFYRSANYDANNRNVKILRGWRRVGEQCDFFAGQAPGNWRIFETEGLNIPANYKGADFSWPTTTPRLERWELKMNSAPGKWDGTASRFIDGKLEVKKDGWPFDSTDKPGLPHVWFIEDDYSPFDGDAGPFPSSAWVKVKPVFIGVK